MKKGFFTAVNNIHFVGIGGIGMSGLAEVLFRQGFNVSGSDLKESENTEYLRNLGIKIFIGHSPENIKGTEVVVYSSAVNVEENPETLEAKRLGIPIIRRAEMLAEVTRLNYTVAVSGTHGKTTTTSLCGHLLINADFDPTVIVGGRLRAFGGINARLGNGEWTVVEADEYDRSFLQLSPTIAIVNNIEPEHLDIYKDFDDIKRTFVEFLNKVPFYGVVVAGIDDPGVKDILKDIKRKVVTFGLSRIAEFRAEDIVFAGSQTSFECFYNSTPLGRFHLNIPGVHSVKNALATIALGIQLEIDIETIKESLSTFTGVHRRFEVISDSNGIMIVDDYAHHPSEIYATLSAARNGWNRRIIAIFQPHTYTRTLHLAKEFGTVFDQADVLVVTDVYPAREKPIEGVTGKLIADSAREFGHRNVHYIPNLDDIVPFVHNIVQEGDIVITLGAGSIWKIARELAERIK
ncbi:UDP-N-acetylmuramate--L-alanine ligase [Bacteroidetes/Chlorobi group bacterium Naka2016]|jgi:UDP-N-acetylmuramate--alanine ligase|nr:MAG: UDP-N-acetylmuramate--L-alanine ligase [Bacteroidetes/Chlorobi group bacterium Naka2016]